MSQRTMKDNCLRPRPWEYCMPILRECTRCKVHSDGQKYYLLHYQELRLYKYKDLCSTGVVKSLAGIQLYCPVYGPKPTQGLEERYKYTILLTRSWDMDQWIPWTTTGHATHNRVHHYFPCKNYTKIFKTFIGINRYCRNHPFV